MINILDKFILFYCVVKIEHNLLEPWKSRSSAHLSLLLQEGAVATDSDI